MSSSKNLEFKKTAFLNKSNSAFIEEMYLKFVNNDPCLLYTSDAADEGLGVDLGGRRIIKIDSVSSSFKNKSKQSIKFVPFIGSPPIPIQVDWPNPFSVV